MNEYPTPKVEQVGDVRIIRFAAKEAVGLDDDIVGQLGGCAANLGGRHVLLDFTNVERIHSVELGAIIAFNKKVMAAGGRLTLFNLDPLIFEVFAVTRLDTLLSICRGDAEAPEVTPAG